MPPSRRSSYAMAVRSALAILDVDFHHGNGTQDIFYDRADVLFVSCTPTLPMRFRTSPAMKTKPAAAPAWASLQPANA